MLQFLESQGLQKYIDVRCLHSELSEATGMTSDEFDAAADRLIADEEIDIDAADIDDEAFDDDDVMRTEHRATSGVDDATTLVGGHVGERRGTT